LQKINLLEITLKNKIKNRHKVQRFSREENKLFIDIHKVIHEYQQTTRYTYKIIVLFFRKND